MKTGMRSLFLVAGVLLAGCGGGGGGESAAPATTARAVSIECADMTNKQTTACQAAQLAAVRYINAARAVMLNYGNIERGELINISATIENPTAVAYTGYFRIFLDVDCKNGLGQGWTIITLQPVNVPAGQTRVVSVGGQCGGADLGPSTITFSLFDDQAMTVLRDQIVGSFNLI